MRPRWLSKGRAANHPVVRSARPLSDLSEVRALKQGDTSIRHGTHSQYIRGCRCDECVAWQQERSAHRAQKRRMAA